MKRDYKLSSIIIINLIAAMISAIISKILGADNSQNTSAYIIASLLSLVITTIAGFAIARGLLKNRMGSLGEYLDNVNFLNFKVFALEFLISLISSAGLVSFFLTPIQNLTVNALEKGEYLPTNFIIPIVLLVIFGMVYDIFTSYKFFVAADKDQLSFGALFKEVFVVGKDLFKKTLPTYIKLMVLPSIIYIVILVATIRSQMTQYALNPAMDAPMGAIAFILVLALVFLIYIFVASAILQAKLSNFYLDYKKDIPEIEASIEEN